MNRVGETNKAVDAVEELVKRGSIQRWELFRILDDLWTKAETHGHLDGYNEGYWYAQDD